jgi:hypothetical protein
MTWTPPSPGFEPLRVAQPRQLAPGDDQGLLHGVVGGVDVAQDPLGEHEQAPARDHAAALEDVRFPFSWLPAEDASGEARELSEPGPEAFAG